MARVGSEPWEGEEGPVINRVVGVADLLLRVLEAGRPQTVAVEVVGRDEMRMAMEWLLRCGWQVPAVGEVGGVWRMVPPPREGGVTEPE